MANREREIGKRLRADLAALHRTTATTKGAADLAQRVMVIGANGRVKLPDADAA